ncbi:hypothetical protein BOTBODRAFT_54544 [Botryobasidium botryosum FD-172 SS1]|uniref:Uncharacterized protein n=1 Tax=Botryobasidium botryosum (strain FD-172 SS1) TaxID=930990 RepID=A0A067MVR4_BOTB1|nr:hypothetical protein BOTBODRAFT_54544 [Botryobasidium botryosum FD-172 SS1]
MAPLLSPILKRQASAPDSSPAIYSQRPVMTVPTPLIIALAIVAAVFLVLTVVVILFYRSSPRASNRPPRLTITHTAHTASSPIYTPDLEGTAESHGSTIRSGRAKSVSEASHVESFVTDTKIRPSLFVSPHPSIHITPSSTSHTSVDHVYGVRSVVPSTSCTSPSSRHLYIPSTSTHHSSPLSTSFTLPDVPLSPVVPPVLKLSTLLRVSTSPELERMSPLSPRSFEKQSPRSGSIVLPPLNFSLPSSPTTASNMPLTKSRTTSPIVARSLSKSSQVSRASSIIILSDGGGGRAGEGPSPSPSHVTSIVSVCSFGAVSVSNSDLFYRERSAEVVRTPDYEDESPAEMNGRGEALERRPPTPLAL